MSVLAAAAGVNVVLMAQDDEEEDYEEEENCESKFNKPALIRNDDYDCRIIGIKREYNYFTYPLTTIEEVKNRFKEEYPNMEIINFEIINQPDEFTEVEIEAIQKENNEIRRNKNG